jgi:Protein of unknown function (DUF2946)
MRSRLLRKIGSIVGLLAILMTALAPTVSQALAANERVDALLAAYCSAAIHESEPASKDTPLSSHQGVGHWETCGYCNLTAHTPVVPSWRASTLTLSVTHAPPVPYPAQHSAPCPPVFSAQPRAPPSLA